MLQYFDTLTDDSGNTLLAATVTVTNYPSGTLASIYLTNGTASPIANSVVAADITGQVSFYAPDGAYTLTYAYKGTNYKVRSPVQLGDPIGFVAIPDTGAANAYVVTDQRLPAQLYTGLKIEILAANTNTGDSTLNVNATGAQPWKQAGGSALAAGMVPATGLVRAEWDGAKWQLLGSQSQPFYATTPLEIANGVAVVNNTYLPGSVHRYGAALTYNASVNDLPFFNAAALSWGTSGGKISGTPRTYQINGTLDITTLCPFDFSGTNNDGGAANGFILFSNTNAPILRYPGGARFLHTGNFAIVGTTSAGVNQHGLVVNNAGVFLDGFTIRACGGDGMQVLTSAGAAYKNGYISLCTGHGVTFDSTVSNNVGNDTFVAVNVTGNGKNEWNLKTMTGANIFIGCDGEQSVAGYGIYFGNGVKGNRFYHHFSELNGSGAGQGSVLFDVGSDQNEVQFNSFSSSVAESAPVNSGGQDNIWYGRQYLQRPVKAKAIDRIDVAFNVFASAVNPNAITYNATVPQSNQGLTIASPSITPKAVGTKLVLRCWGFFEATAGTVATLAVFINANANASYAKPMAIPAVNTPVPFEFEFEFTSVSTAGVTFNVNLGVNNGVSTITFNGSAGANVFGTGVTKSGASIEEFWP